MTTDLRVERRRGPAVESIHRVSVAVVGHQGALLAHAGDADLVTYWRSAAKPFQAMPLLEDGVLGAFGLGTEELALACASHSSEAMHLALTDRFLERIGRSESDLACGPHRPLGEAVAREVAAKGITMTPRWSNCSGKHAGFLALALHHHWDIAGYHLAGHPVQDRVREAITKWTGLGPDEIVYATDGCATVCFGLPLRNMALAYARFAASSHPHAMVVRNAMLAHPAIVAGTGRSCTDIMNAAGGRIVAKIGADGIYCAALVGAGVGVALKVEDGDMGASVIALIEVLRQVFAKHGVPGFDAGALAAHRTKTLTSTTGEEIGEIVPAGELTFDTE